MNDERIRAILDEVAAEFGMPNASDVDNDWVLTESARRVLVENVSEPHCIAPLIDHTLLKPNATENDIRRICEEAIEYRFASVCVNPCWVLFAAESLGNSNSMVCTVVGFPLGANTTEIKAEEAIRAVEDGADELDMVMNIGAAKSAEWETVYADIASVVDAAFPVPVKVILETAILIDEEIIRACAISASAGAAYVKTSTGFSKGGATVEAVEIMSKTVGDKLGVKASGGIGDFEKAMSMIKAGATRIGASRSLTIIGL